MSKHIGELTGQTTNNESFLFDYHEALKQMHEGKVVEYVGTVNGNVNGSHRTKFCMLRGCIFLFESGQGAVNTKKQMVYDPNFRYQLTGETISTNSWVYQ
jgi:hypothetical protein